MIDVYRYITFAEKTILVLIAFFTIFGVGTEMQKVFETGAVVLLALAALVIRWNLIKLKRDPEDINKLP